MLRDEIAPQLRSLGLKGSGQNFYLPSESHWALLGFQKSQWSDASRVSFTVNLTIVGHEDWVTGRAAWPNLPERPRATWGLPPMMKSAFADYWHTRIGSLMPSGRDQWWDVTADARTSDIADAVVADIREFAVPAMLERMTAPDRQSHLGVQVDGVRA